VQGLHARSGKIAARPPRRLTGIADKGRRPILPLVALRVTLPEMNLEAAPETICYGGDQTGQNMNTPQDNHPIA
jgi:hypothetical protein